MHSSLMIIVTRPPATGKSTLARQIAKKFSLPLIQFDTIQETMFDQYPDLPNEAIAKDAYDQLFSTAAEFLVRKKSFVIESNFDIEKHQERFRKLESPDVYILQILCDAKRAKIVERFEQRWLDRHRHPRHNDRRHFEGIKTAELIERKPLKLQGELISLDTTDFASIDTDKLCGSIDRLLAIDV